MCLCVVCYYIDCQLKDEERVVVEVAGISVCFETGELGGEEVLVLRCRLGGFVVVGFFAETCDSCSGEVCSAMDNMVGFVYCLMGFVSGCPECFY